MFSQVDVLTVLFSPDCLCWLPFPGCCLFIFESKSHWAVKFLAEFAECQLPEKVLLG
jgi:hypothetical protein